MELFQQKICLDTDIIINFLKGKKEETEFIQEHLNTSILFTTPITIYELYYGAYRLNNKKELNILNKFIKCIPVITFSKIAAKEAAMIASELRREGRTLEHRDIFIASIAKTYKCKLKTNNKIHFERIRELELI